MTIIENDAPAREGTAKGPPVRLVVCFRSLAALDALDALLAELADQPDVPPTSVLLQTTDPRDILHFLAPPATESPSSPDTRFDCAFLLDATLDAPGSGILLADHIREHSVDVPILFLTDHLEYVLIAFRSQPFDFLPRPVSAERFADSLRALSRLQSQTAPGSRRTQDQSMSLSRTSPWSDSTTPVLLRLGGTTYRIAAGEILFIERNKTVTTLHLASRRIDCNLPLTWFVDHLGPTGLFLRCHKSFLVNRRHIREIDLAQRTLVLTYGHRCDIGRTYRANMAAFEDPHRVRAIHVNTVRDTGRGES